MIMRQYDQRNPVAASDAEFRKRSDHNSGLTQLLAGGIEYVLTCDQRL